MDNNKENKKNINETIYKIEKESGNDVKDVSSIDTDKAISSSQEFQDALSELKGAGVKEVLGDVSHGSQAATASHNKDKSPSR